MFPVNNKVGAHRGLKVCRMLAGNKRHLGNVADAIATVAAVAAGHQGDFIAHRCCRADGAGYRWRGAGVTRGEADKQRGSAEQR